MHLQICFSFKKRKNVVMTFYKSVFKTIWKLTEKKIKTDSPLKSFKETVSHVNGQIIFILMPSRKNKVLCQNAITNNRPFSYQYKQRVNNVCEGSLYTYVAHNVE